jgi:hypothetical protein
MRNRVAVAFLSLSAVLGIGMTPGLTQEQTPEQEVEALIRAQYAAWSSGDLEESRR